MNLFTYWCFHCPTNWSNYSSQIFAALIWFSNEKWKRRASPSLVDCACVYWPQQSTRLHSRVNGTNLINIAVIGLLSQKSPIYLHYLNQHQMSSNVNKRNSYIYLSKLDLHLITRWLPWLPFTNKQQKNLSQSSTKNSFKTSQMLVLNKC